jgi:radical SAM/Cys-rich protein
LTVCGRSFDDVLATGGCSHLVREQIKTLQINLGRVCNQACLHCHVDAGPNRSEIMTAELAKQTITVLAASTSISTVDITGGAPELNPLFREIVVRVRKMGRHVIDRCNLTVLFEQGMDDLPAFLAKHQVEIVASLPCYTTENVDRQRGHGVFDKSIRALQLLNGLGYGLPDLKLPLNLVYNPLGAFLPPDQEKLEADYKFHLREQFGIEFHRLFTIANMPIRRFAGFLCQSGKYEAYMELLVSHFNCNTVANLMCRSLVSIGWDGGLYDCDFNQMLGIGIADNGAKTIWDIASFDELNARPILTGRHCFGCTAGNGSSCGGSIQ